MVALALGQCEPPARSSQMSAPSAVCADREAFDAGSFRSTAPGEGSMAVSLRDRRPPPKADTIETRARYAWHDIEGDWRAASPRPAGSRRQSYATASDRNFERVERFFYIGAAALVVVGTAIVVGSAFWGELPQNGDPAEFDDASKNSASRAARGAEPSAFGGAGRQFAIAGTAAFDHRRTGGADSDARTRRIGAGRRRIGAGRSSVEPSRVIHREPRTRAGISQRRHRGKAQIGAPRGGR